MKAFLYSCLPAHFLSRLVGALANCRWGWFKNAMIKWFIHRYKVNIREADRPHYRQYHSFNDFFTRELKPGARPIAEASNAIISPVDGLVSAYGKIEDKTLIQAKGKTFSLESLLAGQSELVQHFRHGEFMTAYLAPSDYHCFHMPLAGELEQMIYVPGHLFSVNQASVASVDNLFGRNERVICIFQTEIGPIAYIAVGAMLVGSIAMQWHGVVNAKHGSQLKRYQYQHAPQKIKLAKADKVGCFQMGSTVILLLPPNKINWQRTFENNEPLRFGQAIATISGKTEHAF